MTRTPSYDFDASCQVRQKIMVSYDEGKSFTVVLERTIRPYSHFVPLREPAADGKFLALARGDVSGTMVLLESEDNGQTLTKRSCPDFREPIYPGDIKPFNAGIAVSGYTAKGTTVIFYSGDDGHTWSDPATIAEPVDNMSFHEPAIEALDDKCLLCVMRTHRQDIPKHNGINYHQVQLEFENGKFTALGKLQDTGIGFRGRPQLLQTSNGILILSAPGGLLAFSTDGGAIYELDLHTLKDIPAVTYHGKPYNHNADVQFLLMPDGDVLCSYFIGSDLPFPPPIDEYIGVSRFHVEEK